MRDLTRSLLNINYECYALYCDVLGWILLSLVRNRYMRVRNVLHYVAGWPDEIITKSIDESNSLNATKLFGCYQIYSNSGQLKTESILLLHDGNVCCLSVLWVGGCVQGAEEGLRKNRMKVLGWSSNLLKAKEPYLYADTNTPPRVSLVLIKRSKVTWYLLIGRPMVTEHTTPCMNRMI
jgi:hypothetical protein